MCPMCPVCRMLAVAAWCGWGWLFWWHAATTNTSFEGCPSFRPYLWSPWMRRGHQRYAVCTACTAARRAGGVTHHATHPSCVQYQRPPQHCPAAGPSPSHPTPTSQFGCRMHGFLPGHVTWRCQLQARQQWQRRGKHQQRRQQHLNVNLLRGSWRPPDRKICTSGSCRKHRWSQPLAAVRSKCLCCPGASRPEGKPAGSSCPPTACDDYLPFNGL